MEQNNRRSRRGALRVVDLKSFRLEALFFQHKRVPLCTTACPEWRSSGTRMRADLRPPLSRSGAQTAEDIRENAVGATAAPNADGREEAFTAAAAHRPAAREGPW